jgi:hypothetical protein
MSSITNIPINTRSMNGIITISDGVATMENGDLSNINNLDANTLNTITANFNTDQVDIRPLKVQYLGAPNNQIMSFCPNTSTGTYSPYCQDGDAFLGADTNIVLGRQDRYNAVRLTDNEFNLLASNSIYLEANGQMVAEFEEPYINFYSQFISNVSYPISSTQYENMFFGDIWSYKGLSSRFGLYIQDDITPGSTTYASINSTGDAQLATIYTQASAKDIATYTTDNSLSTGYIKLYSNTTNALSNPIVSNNDCLMLSSGPSSSGLVIARETTSLTGIRITEETLQLEGSTELKVSGNQFRSTASNTGTAPSNYFLNDITCDDQITSRTGYFVKDILGATKGSIDGGGSITGSSLSITGAISSSTANITTITTTTQLPTDSSTKCATTAWVVSQNFAFRTTSNTFTAPNTFRSTSLNGVPFYVRSARITPNPQLSICVDTTAGAYNPIVQAGDAILFTDNCSGIVVGTHTSSYAGFRCDDITTTLYGKSILEFYIWDKGMTPAIQLNATNNVSNSRLDCNVGLTIAGGPITPPETDVATTSKHDGFQISPTITSPTGNTAQQIASVIFDNATNYSFGTYFFEYHLTINTTASREIKCAFNTTSASLTGNYRDSVYTPAVPFDSNLNNSGMIRIYSNQTWYLNFHVLTGAYIYTNGLFRLTRVA